MEPLRDQRRTQAETFEMYRNTALHGHDVNHAIMQLYRVGVIGMTRIADVLDAYEKPLFDWGSETAYRLFNAATFTMNGHVMEAPMATAKLHQVIDDLYEDAFWDKVRAPVEQLVLPAPFG